MIGIGVDGVTSWVETGGEATGPGAGGRVPDAPSVWRKCRKSSAMSRPVLYRSEARFASAFWQIRSSSRGIVSSI